MAVYPIIGIALGVVLAVVVSLYWLSPLAIFALPLFGFLLGRRLERGSRARRS
jgi:hypothetical protein